MEFAAAVGDSTSSRPPVALVDSAIVAAQDLDYDLALIYFRRCLRASENPRERDFLLLSSWMVINRKLLSLIRSETDTLNTFPVVRLGLAFADSLKPIGKDESTYWRLRLANCKFLEDNLAEIACLRELTRLQPDAPYNWSNLAWLYSSVRNFPAVDSAFEVANQLGEISASDWELWARARSILHNYAGCVEACDSGLAVYPGDATILDRKAICLTRLERFEEAIDILENLISKDSRDPYQKYELGYAKFRVGKPTEAIVWFRLSLESSFPFLNTYYYMSRCAEQLGDFTAAIIYADSAVTLTPSISENHRLLGRLLEKQDRHSESAAAYEGALARERDNPEIWWEVAGVYSKAGRDTDMFAALDKTLKFNPSHIQALRLMANEKKDRGNYSEALKYLDRLVKIDATSVDDWADKSVTEYLAGQYEESLKSCNEAIRLAPYRSDLKDQKRDVLLKLGRKE